MNSKKKDSNFYKLTKPLRGLKSLWDLSTKKITPDRVKLG